MDDSFAVASERPRIHATMLFPRYAVIVCDVWYRLLPLLLPACVLLGNGQSFSCTPKLLQGQAAYQSDVVCVKGVF